MTTEDDFQAALDADPNDWQTRLVFADWLTERGDDRAEGYRALAARRWRPYQPHPGGYWTVGDYRAKSADDVSDLPGDWFDHVWAAAPRGKRNPASVGRWISADTRRAVEDASARAFAQLPPERRAELLAAAPPDPPAKPASGRRKR